MHSDLAAQTLERASSALKVGAVTWLPEIVKLMRSLSGNSAGVSVADLAELIQRDSTILAKVIAAANTMGFNPSAVPVTGVTEAIHVIGYERIRTLAMSLMLSENSARQRSPDEQREAIALALTSGCVAQSVADGCMLLDPGRAFVCASLRHFGRIVMTACMPDDYRAAQKLAGSDPDDDAFRGIFGLTPLELGRALLKSADLPPEILACLRELPPETLNVIETTPDDRMLALTDFAARLAQLALAPDPGETAFAENAQALANRYSHLLPGVADRVPQLLRHAEHQLNGLVRNLRLGGVSVKSLNRLRHHCLAAEAAASGEVAPTPAPKAAPPAAPTVSPIAPAVPALGSRSPVAPAGAPFDWQGEAERFALFLRKPGLTRDEIFTCLVGRLSSGLDAPECLLFSAGANPSVFRLSHGHGLLFPTLRSHAQVRSDERTVLGICLARRENVLIHRAEDPGIRAHFPGWLLETNRLGAFALLPLVHQQRSLGVVLVGWRNSHQIQLGAEQAKLIRNLIGLVCQACDQISAPGTA